MMKMIIIKIIIVPIEYKFSRLDIFNTLTSTSVNIFQLLYSCIFTVCFFFFFIQYVIYYKPSVINEAIKRLIDKQQSIINQLFNRKYWLFLIERDTFKYFKDSLSETMIIVQWKELIIDVVNTYLDISIPRVSSIFDSKLMRIQC